MKKEKLFISISKLIITFIILFNPNVNFKENIFLLLAVLTAFSHLYLTYKLFKLEPLAHNSFFKQNLDFTYLIIPFALLTLIPFSDNNYTPSVIFGVLLIIWCNDTFAYLVGKNFGKRKLFEKISPKKTIEGFIGGAIFGIVASIIIAQTTNCLNTTHWIALGLIIAVFGTIGDLVASKFKREANIKDSSNLIPGHGGFLDRLDSLIFVSSFVYLYIQFINYVS